MKIIKYKKIRDSKYELTFDNTSKVDLYEDIIIKYNLLNKEEITSNEMDEIIKENQNIEAYYISVKYLNTKLRSTLEIKKYLKKHNHSNKIIDETIKKLTAQGYLNDKVYMESYINDQFNLTNNGPEKIKRELIKLGIKDNIIIDKDFSEKIIKLIDKKVKANNKMSKKILKNNISNYLFNLGYNQDMFINYLNEIEVDDYKFIKKEYEKIYRKQINKVEPSKLKFVVKEKLYQKGYDIDLINEIVGDE